ncbi:MAG: valine--tRNA ligase [Gammaproteobacteria bacterium]|nr:valine--tRNA ligase [Gammaproteobacteria bacterium]
MEKTFSPQHIEQQWYQKWEAQHYFKPSAKGKPFCIMLPPPNVTGSLHMGHGFQHTLMDILTRYHRMMGDKTLWQPGTDHAGISTQLVVENQLQQQGILRKDLPRERFLEKVWEWKHQSGSQITSQMRQLGTSPDWSRERFTMDEPLSFAVQKVFIQLYEEGLIYRGTRLVNWDPVLGTAVSDLEVISEEEDGQLWFIRYQIAESSESLVVATTRPETLLGDTAVAVHPDDERYQHLIGKQIQLPLTDRLIPIVADEAIDPAFGTGCVKITPAHDFNDYEIAKRHDLPHLTILTKKGTLNKHVPMAYQGMSCLKARDQIVQDLTLADLLVEIKPHRLKIPRGEKSNAIIEPLLTDQWYVKTAPLAQPAIDAVKSGEVRFVPETWSKTYFQWMENIQDWCISRQLWWGHRIPAWYDNQGRVYVGYTEEDVRFKHNILPDVPLKQDEDVLDTWFSSALWPFSTLGWPEKTPALREFYPTSVLVTGFDIIFFWVARMLMMSLKFTGLIPFKEVLITGLIRDSDGQKMSKSKGNVLDPMDVIHGITLPDLIKKRTGHLLLTSKAELIKKQTEKDYPDGIPAYGTDALRFTYCALANFGRNVRFDMQRVDGYRNFCNKLWNATRFVLMNVTDASQNWGDEAIHYTPADLWVRSYLQHVIEDTHTHIAAYRFDRLANTLYDFVWHIYCDWYIEFSKTVLYDDATLLATKRGTIETLLEVLDTVLHLLHPIMPFITEEISLHLSKVTGCERESLMISPYPTANEQWANPQLEQEFSWLQDIIQAIRTLRSEMNVPPGTLVPLILKNMQGPLKKRLVKGQQLLFSLGKLNGITLFNEEDTMPVSTSMVVGEVEVCIPMAGLLNKTAELARLDKELAKLAKDIIYSEGKLNNEQFVAKAPPEVIEKEKEKLAQAIQARDKVLVHQTRIAQL